MTSPLASPSVTNGESAPGWTFLRSRRWFGYVTMFLIFAVACVWLGNWQFDRRAEAREEIARIDNNYDAPAVPLADELPTLTSFDERVQKWRTVRVTGEYTGEPILARNRPGPDGVGSDLIQGLLTDDGTVFYINRGWVPVDGITAEDDAFDAAELPKPASGTVTVDARLRASERALQETPGEGLTVASINLPEITEHAGTEDRAYTAAYGMLITETPAGEHGALPPKPERDEGPHLSYALQWFIFIIIAGSGVVYAARREYRTLNAGSETVRRQDRQRLERRRRRGPTDADEEDALIDALE